MTKNLLQSQYAHQVEVLIERKQVGDQPENREPPKDVSAPVNHLAGFNDLERSFGGRIDPAACLGKTYGTAMAGGIAREGIPSCHGETHLPP